MTIDPARAAEFLAHGIATLMAWRRTRLGRIEFAPTLRPLWRFLALTLTADVVRGLLQHFVLQDASRPFTGLARAAFHVDQAGVIGWQAGLLAVVVLAFTGKQTPTPKLLPIASCAVGTIVSFAFAYPDLRGDRLAAAYTMLQIATSLACVSISAWAWFQHRWFGIAARAASMLVVGEIATLFGPFLGEPFKHWGAANAVSAVTYLVLARELRCSTTVVT